MTHLRKMMLEELERRNYAQTTISSYIRTIEDFARYFRCPPDQLTPEHIREYQAYLFRERKLAASTVTQRLAALRFFYTRTIKKAWSVADTPYPKKTRHLPSILSPEEVAHLIDSSQTRFHRVVLMTLYGTGVRRAELTRLQIPDTAVGYRASGNFCAGPGWPELLPSLQGGSCDFSSQIKFPTLRPADPAARVCPVAHRLRRHHGHAARHSREGPRRVQQR